MPAEIVELYGWRDGQTEEGELAVDSFRFRDNDFVSVERALAEYAVILSTHGRPKGSD